jgi:heme/copper-type cytochrome/quinol oxidase subunit 3
MIEKHKMGMALFLLSEVFFFALLILAYIFFNGTGGSGQSESLAPATAAIFTVFLLGSSGTLWLAERSLAREHTGGLRLWLLITIVLGAIFLIGQGREYALLIGENVTISSSLFGSSFFTLTGFHGLHVFSGLVALAIVLLLALRQPAAHAHATALETIGWYWHFVDVVWIVIFTIIYLLPLL